MKLLRYIFLAVVALQFSSISHATYSSEVLADSPVAYWRLGDTSGTTAADSSGNSHPGTYTGGYTLNQTGLDGSADKAVLFNGTSGYVTAGTVSALNIVGNVTVEAIIKVAGFPADGGWGAVVSHGFDSSSVQGYALDVRTVSGVHKLSIASYHNHSGEDATFGTLFDISGWSTGQTHHVVGRYDGTAWKLFVDGSEVASTNAAEGALASGEPIVIGAFTVSGSVSRYFNGTIDEVAIYNTSLSNTRILAHATAAGLASASLAVGSSTATATSSSTITATCPAATGGTATYSYQFQRAPDSSGSPGTWANVGSARTGLALGVAPTDLSDTGLSALTKYWYRCVVTDSAGTPATVNSTAASATTFSASAPTVSATVPAHGAHVALTFSAAVTGVAIADYQVKVGGYQIALSSASGSGTAWQLNIGNRWINSGQTVTLTYTGTATIDGGSTPMATFSNAAVTNSSATTDLQAMHIGDNLGIFLHFNVNTFNNVELASGSETANSFNPTSLNIDQWIDAAQLAGAKYMILTAKHHGGFCMWTTATTSYSIASSTWYATNQIDVVRQFATRCRSRGMGVGLYFSVWDKNWEAAHPGFTSSQYTTWTVNQLTELLTQYGRIDYLWTDGWGWQGGTPTGWDVGYSVVPYATIRSLVTSLQPNCLLIENNHEGTNSHSDVIEFEYAVDGAPSSTNLYPLETCQTIRSSGNWFHHSGDTANMSASTILSQLSTINSRRGLYLINVPPDTTGQISAADVYLLSQVGAGVLKPNYKSTQIPVRTFTF